MTAGSKVCHLLFCLDFPVCQMADAMTHWQLSKTKLRLKKLSAGESRAAQFCEMQARNQSGQTKPYLSRLGSCQCCTLKLKYWIAMNLAHIWTSFGRIQKNISYLTDNFLRQGYKVLFFPLPRCNYGCTKYGYFYFKNSCNFSTYYLYLNIYFFFINCL